MISRVAASLGLANLFVNAYGASIATAWYASWHANKGFPLESVPWSKYTQLTYAFAETSPDSPKSLSLTVNGDTGPSSELLKSFVTAAHENHVKASVSIGGWTGSRWWSTAVGSAHNRTTFVKTVTEFADQFDLDGLDFDWEYPGVQGIGCNTINDSEDSNNFLLFLQELRQDPVGSKLILSAATSTRPYEITRQPVSAFSDVLDFIAIMNYDIWGPWSGEVGPNAPLDDTCVSSDKQVGSAVSAVKAWTDAGFPASQIVLGVAGYGHSFTVHPEDAFESDGITLAPYPIFDPTNPPTGDSWDDPPGVDECGNQQNAGGKSCVNNFWGLIENGYLDESGDPRPGIANRFDTCSQTPYVYEPTTQIMVSFDNVRSFTAKGEFIRDKGLAGFSMWEAGGDKDDILLDAIRSAAF
ncbi:glycoside hydrolase [Marasmius fiardii PR-910]|nr:glycoside hydrolase [Marasmius fiardii PR-910]